MQRAEPQSFGRVLSSMCTVPHPTAREAAERFLATNPGDPATYERIAELEERAVATLGEIARLDSPSGYVTSGGSEANIQAMRIARNRFTDGENGHTRNETLNAVVPESAHFSFSKAADVLGVELRRAPVDGEYRADPEAMAELVDDDTVLVAAIAGTTEYGRVDPVTEIADLAEEMNVLCHVDAAWGGFCLPFSEYEWDFSDAPIDTMTIDPHKMGRAVIPAGGLLARESTLLDELATETPYLESTSQATLTGTRSGAGVASAAAVMDALWPDGYRENYERAQRNADWLARELDERGYSITDPTLPLLASELPEDEFDALRETGWRLSRTASGDVRVVCMPHVTRSMLRSFLDDLDSIR